MLADLAVKRHFGEGTAIVVATCDADGVPLCCRAVGLVAGPGPERVTVYLPVATAAETIANLATTGNVAVESHEPVSHRAVQLKGKSRAVRIAREDERAHVTAWVEKFTDVVHALGLPRALSRALTHWPAFAVEVEVQTVFNQTPGPRAGMQQ